MNVDSLKAELEREVQTTRRFLERIPAEALTWRPHQKSFTAGALGSHLVDCIGWVETICLHDQFDIDPATFRPFGANSTAELLDGFEQQAAASLRAFGQLGNPDLAKTWQLSIRGKVRVARSKSEALRDFAFGHLAHHRGQLSVYLRLLDVPVPGAFGPTADEST